MVSPPPYNRTGEIVTPRLSITGYLRFAWRQLTSMRTALVLLLLLAIAAIPGSLVPQRSSDPNGVIQYEKDNPETFATLDALGVFSTFSSPWFSAIYLLLFVSLIGCIIPRTKHHLVALAAHPPKTPARLARLIGYTTSHTDADIETIIVHAHDLLRRSGYRVQRYGDSLSAERGYLKESGNLIFHTCLVGILITVGFGGGFGYQGQKVIVQDAAFTNSLASYDSFNPGRFFTENTLKPFAMRLDDFDGIYQLDLRSLIYQPVDFTAWLSTREPDKEWTPTQLKVNQPVTIGGMKAYLLGNGYAPEVRVLDPEGGIVFSGAVPFLPQDNNLYSTGVIKVPDGLGEQLGLLGFFYPAPVPLTDGTYTSASPYAGDTSLLTLTVYRGDLGLDEGVSVNAYTLDIDRLTLIAGRHAAYPALVLNQGESVALPEGLGTIEFVGLKRFVTIDFHHDPTGTWVLIFALLVLSGLLVSLFVPRRRMWVKASVAGDTVLLEYAGLARGEDPRLAAAVAEFARLHGEKLSAN